MNRARRHDFPAACAGFHLAAAGLARINASGREALEDGARDLEAARDLIDEGVDAIRACLARTDPRQLDLFGGKFDRNG